MDEKKKKLLDYDVYQLRNIGARRSSRTLKIKN